MARNLCYQLICTKLTTLFFAETNELCSLGYLLHSCKEDEISMIDWKQSFFRC